MAQKVKCANPECGNVFEVEDGQRGQRVYCPKCGSPTQVPEAAAPAGEGPAGPKEEKPGVLSHPARQQCPNCGSVLGVRVAICPQCGADIRTGAAVKADEGKGKKFNLVPVVIGGSIVVGLAVLVLLAVVAVRILAQRSKAAESAKAPIAGQAEVVAKVDGAKEKKPTLQVSEKELGALGSQEQQMRQAVEAYKARLNDTLARQRKARPEEAAGYWADLYKFCQDSGLHVEAEQCWLRAVQLRPADQTVNAKLGRTETFAGAPVTPEQKRFLEALRPKVRIINRNASLAGCSARVGKSERMALGSSDAPEFTPDPGSLQVEVTPAGTEAAAVSFPLTVQAGLVYTITLKEGAACPPLDFGTLAKLYTAVSTGREGEGATVRSNLQGQVTSAQVGELSVQGTDEAPVSMQLSRGGDSLTVIGALATGSRYGQDGQDVLYGSAQHPLRLGIDPQAKRVSVQGGTCCGLRVDLAPGLWGALATAQGDFASQWAARALAAHLQGVTFKNEVMEARGEFYDLWQEDARAFEEMTSFSANVAKELAYQDAAAQKPDSVDRIRVLGIQDRDAHLYLNWPQFRGALSAATQDSYQAILAVLDLMSQKGQEAGPGPGGRGPMIEGPPLEVIGEGPMRGGPGFGAPGALTQQAASPLAPKPVALDRAGHLYARMRILPFLPDRAALEDVRENWDALPADAQVAAMVSLEKVATPEAIDFLGGLSREARQTEVVTGALLSLGAIGTSEALNYCESPAVVPAVRMAVLAAKAAAGDPEVLEGLGKSLKAADPKSRVAFLEFVTAMDTPSTVAALSSVADLYTDDAHRAKIAAALVRIGGQAAMVALADLMSASGNPFPDLLERVSPQDAVLLVRPVGLALAQGKGGENAVTFLARNGGEAGLALVKAAAEQGKNADAEFCLLRIGSTQTIEAAGAAIGVVDLPMLEKARQAWLTVPSDGGEWAWNARVDTQAARAFIRKVLADGQNAKVKLAAAWMLMKTGEKPDAQALVALAKEPVRKAAAGPGGPGGEGRPGMGPPMGREDEGPPEGRRFGPPRAASYSPAGFREPKGEPQMPRDFKLDGRDQLYALGLLIKSGDPAASAALREFSDTYKDPVLKAAAMRALAEAGGEENLKFLRGKATTHKGAYAKQAEFIEEFQDRLAALNALGFTQDTAFLPALSDLLQESAPPAGAVKEVQGDYADLSGWYEVELWTVSCRCLTEMCRYKQLFELTADSALQQQIVRRLMSLIEEPGPLRPSLSGVRTALQVEAVRAFGRCANPTDEQARLVVNRLALAPAAPPTPGRGFPREEEGFEAPGTVPQAQKGGGTLQDALRDAVVHMAVHGGGLGLLTAVPNALPRPDRSDAYWSDLLKTMAEAPTPDYFLLVNLAFDSLGADARQAIYELTRSKVSGQDMAYAGFLAKMIKAPFAAEQAKEVAALSGRTAQPTTAGRRGPPPEVLEMMRREAEARAGMVDRPDGLPPLAFGSAGPEVKYNRTDPRRKVAWSYSIEKFGEALVPLRRRWAVVEALFKTQGSAAASALQTEGLIETSEFGPAVAAMSVEQAPSTRDEVVRSLGELLVGPPSPAPGPAAAPAPPGTQASPAVQRAAVMVLRKIGGDDAAKALFGGLVGPPVQPMVMVGPRVEGPPPWVAMGGPRGEMGPPGFMAQADLPAARYAAQALGTMGHVEMLKQALNASGYQFFARSPQVVQMAALRGIAFLPADREPLKVLDELIKRANAPDLKKAAADAMATAMQLMGAV